MGRRGSTIHREGVTPAGANTVRTASKRQGRAGGMATLLASLALYPAVGVDAAEGAVARRAANFGAAEHAGITREQAVGEVRRVFDGRILSATAVERGGAMGFRVRLLTADGRVRNVYVDRAGVTPEG